MKVRLRGNTVRLRLARGEVASLAAGGSVQEATHFAPGQVLRCVAEPGAGAMAASFIDGCLRITVPADAARAWAQGDEVTLAGTQGSLQISVEKDFACLTPRGEDDHDAFPHPQAKEGGAC